MLRRQANNKKINLKSNHENALKKSDLSELDRLDIHYDDSSDEDEVSEKISKYKISTHWKQKASKTYLKYTGKDILKNNDLLSFVAHAAGIKLLYSKGVNQQYYPIKKDVLGEQNCAPKPRVQLEKLVMSGCIDSAKDAFRETKRFLDLSKQKKINSDNFTACSEASITEFIKELEKLIPSKLTILSQWVKKAKYCNEQESRPPEIKALENEMAAILQNIFTRHSPISSSKEDIDRKKIKEELFDIIKQIITDMSRELRFDKLSNAQGKQDAIAVLDSHKCPYSHLLKEIKSMLANSQARGYVENMLLKQFDDNKEKLLQLYIKDVTHIQNNKTKKNALKVAEKSALDKYLIIDHASLSDELTSAFLVSLQSKLHDSITAFHRPTLGKSYLMTSSNPYSFLANLRLANRSQKRLALNLKGALFNTDTVSRTWQLSSPKTRDTQVLETQQITSTFGRRDIIENLGSYEKVYNAINQLKKYFEDSEENVSDVTIAKWLREIYQGKTPDINSLQSDHAVIIQKLQTITYLLFGCEATRNPAMHVINQMLLDLIIHDENWSFEEAFTGKHDGKSVNRDPRRMPMAPEGAVAVARGLESDYRKFMPYPYFYYGVEESEGKDNKLSKNELIKFEGQVVRDWVKLNTNGAIRVGKRDCAEWLLEKIESHFEVWLGNPPKIVLHK